MRFLKAAELMRSYTPSWCRRLGVDPHERLYLSAPALLVLDMQNDMLRQTGCLPVWGGPAIVPSVSNLLKAFRKAGLAVIFTRHVCMQPDAKAAAKLAVSTRIRNPHVLLREHYSGSRIVRLLRPRASEPVITKYQYSGFYNTPLEYLLRSHGVSEVVISGVITNVCCETTAHDAFFRGFRVLFTVDGTGAFDEQSHQASLATIRQSYGQVVTVDQVVQAVRSLRGGRS